VLILPGIVIPTPAVYRKFDELGLGHPQNLRDEPDWKRWIDLSANDLLPRLVNDLEPAAFALQPELGEIRKDAQTRLGRPVRMSGSGSTLFTLFDERDSAERAAVDLSQQTALPAMALEIAPSLRDDLIC
jgi:4-diphosphocytidyl-2-C-methyl-D-erythritol kinase